MFGKSLYLFLFAVINSCTANYPSANLTDPHLVIISTIGINTTSLANVLLGKSPECPNCLTDICSDMTTAAGAENFLTTPNIPSITEKTTIKPAKPSTSTEHTDATTTAEYNKCTTQFKVGDWLGASPKLSIFHAPEFGEPFEYDKVKNLVDILREFAITNNRFLIVMDATIDDNEANFDNNLDQVLSQLGALFGRDFWKRVVLGAVNWHYDMDSIIARNQTGRGEEWWTDKMSSYVQRRFDVNANFSTVFIDADAKRSDNVDDPLQNEAFERESGRLLDLTMNTLSMKMNTMEEINDELSGVINSTLVNMQANIDELMKNMVEVQDDIIDNGIDISYVKGIVALNQIDIETHSYDLNEIHHNISDMHQNISDIHQNIGARGFECIDDIILTIPCNITSANYPDNYPLANDCTFTLIPQVGMAIHLEFLSFKTYKTVNYIEITPSGGSASNYSGSSLPPTTTYDVDQSVLLLFHSNSDKLYSQDDNYQFHAVFGMI